MTAVRSRWRIFALVCLGGVVAPAMLLTAVTDGALDRQIEGLLSARLGRGVRFVRLGGRLLSARPELTLYGLEIASPAWAGPQPLLIATSVTVQARWPFLLSPSSVTVVKPVLHLVRQGPGEDNWSFGKGRSSGSAGRLVVTGGRFDLTDAARHLALRGVFSYDAKANPNLPLALTGAGRLKGAPLSLNARGAPFAGGYKGGYRFQSELLDGDTHAHLQGVGAGPFNVGAFDLNVRASGPNLADLGYLFGFIAPNSPTYQLAVRVQRDRLGVRLNDIRAVIGRSRLAGDISTSYTSGRRQFRLRLTSPDLWLADVRPLASPRPPHVMTRSQSDALRQSDRAGERLLSDAPFPAEALRSVDVQAVVQANRLEGLSAPVDNAAVHLDLKNGRLSISPITFDLPHGQVSASMLLDTSGPLPRVQVSGRVRQVPLRDMNRRLVHTLDGMLDAWFAFEGRGASARGAALDAVGRIGVRLTDGVFMKSKAAALSGDLMQAVNLSLRDKGSRTALHCAIAELDASKGVLRVDKLVVVTGAGSAVGRGSIDLGEERMAISFQGEPARHRLLQLNVPVLLEGPITRPEAKPQTAQAIRKAGAAGILAIAAGPFAAVLPLVGHEAAQPDCAALTGDVATYVR